MLVDKQAFYLFQLLQNTELGKHACHIQKMKDVVITSRESYFDSNGTKSLNQYSKSKFYLFLNNNSLCSRKKYMRLLKMQYERD